MKEIQTTTKKQLIKQNKYSVKRKMDRNVTGLKGEIDHLQCCGVSSYKLQHS